MVTRDKHTQRFWSVPVEDIFRTLSSSPDGLTDAEAAARLKQYGANSFTAAISASVFLLFVSQF